MGMNTKITPIFKCCNMCCRKMAQASSVDGDGNDQDVAALNKDADEEVCSLQIQPESDWLCKGSFILARKRNFSLIFIAAQCKQ